MTDEEILQSIVFAASFFQELAKEDFMVDVCDKEKFIAHFPGKNVDVDVSIGEPIPKDDVVLQSALKGKGMTGRPPFEVYEVHFLGKTMPIRNGKNEVIGALGIGYNIQEIVELEETIKELEEILMSVQEYTEKVKSSSANLQDASKVLNENTGEVSDNSKQIGNMLELIRKISSQSNILGLNANIESARAGEAGKGFAVVADEIRKLSDGTKKASEEIFTFTNNIQNGVEVLILSLDEVNSTVDVNTEIVTKFSEANSKLTILNERLTESVKRILTL
ncbi:methyl-accepting chemotaxis protein [Salipaludibacillus sp. CF4.18]|uniref:methyl-accepting chemotaxis protein n=1 Tax=Salipaludibacillus sp. CF4.18 TaxID=3373081 RepID=UPI003EE70FBB